MILTLQIYTVVSPNLLLLTTSFHKEGHKFFITNFYIILVLSITDLKIYSCIMIEKNIHEMSLCNVALKRYILSHYSILSIIIGK